MGILDSIKNDVKKAGTSKGKIVFFKEGVKVRIRFLQDMDEGLKILFHDSYAKSINVPCQELFDRKCKYCDDEDLRHRDQYIWSVWDYEAKEVKLFMYPVNNCSPIPALVGMYDTYGTLTDRDYVITRQGRQQSTTFSVVPMDRVKFKNDKAKPFSKSKTLSILDKAFPVDTDDEDTDEDEDDEVLTKSNKKAPKKVSKGKNKKEEVEDDEVDDDTEDGDEYERMTAIELYKLCKKQDIEVKPKKEKDYYIEKLKEYNGEEDEGDAEEDEDEWE